jgi:hypothetical protein
MKYLMIAVLMSSLAACGPGEQGPAGADGADGRNGSGLEKETTCTGLTSFQSPLMALEHVRYDFADGSAFVVCRAIDGDGKNTFSMPTFYGRYDAGYKATGYCVIGYDVSTTDNFGQFEFNVAPNAMTGEAVYKASGSSNNNAKVALNCRQSG